MIGAVLMFITIFLTYATANEEQAEKFKAYPDEIVYEELDMTAKDMVNISMVEYANVYRNLTEQFWDDASYGTFYIAMIALIGVIVSVCWINAPRIISTFFYLLLGWAVIFDFQSFSLLPSHILSLIAYGGISYSVGAIIYIIKKPNISSYFGFHEIFHIFVMVGSLLHYIAVLLLVL